ncbi:MAG: DUF1697 domain-containing protein [Candidatus Pacebacteria bacterium]|nr:DUF1697 domain-containing protein [Candidatus Paceibacterota bacterium]
MTTYVALLRGIMPGNPNMRSAKLKGVFESLGFKDVATVIGSGNVIFDASAADPLKLEAKIEKAIPAQLGFTSATIIRSEAEIERLVKRNPFKGVKDERPNYLLVTFFQDRRKELCSVIDISVGPNKATAHMSSIERKHGKAMTTRTWKTVNRIHTKMRERL